MVETDKEECAGCVSAKNAFLGMLRNAQAWRVNPILIGVMCFSCDKVWHIENGEIQR